MGIQVLPATAERFDDVAIVIGPKNPASSVCWCLSQAYVGTRGLFERSGFIKAADTQSVSGGFPRVLMRLEADARTTSR